MPIPVIPAAIIAGSLIIPATFRILAALGIGVITYIGFDTLLSTATSFITDNVGGIPSDIINGLGFAQVDVYITLTFSAYISALGFKAATKVIGVR